MKKLLKKIIILAFTLSLFSCNNDDDEPIYKFYHEYSWDVDSIDLIIPPSAFDQTFQIKDIDGNIGGIIGVTEYWYGINVQSIHDAVRVDNTALINERNSIISDTIRGDWFTVINEKERLRIILDKNEGTETRMLGMGFWAKHLNITIKSQTVGLDALAIYQQSSKNEKQ